MKDKECSLCNLHKDEKIYWENDELIVLRTHDLKGHKERIMIMYKDHVSDIPEELYIYALYKLCEIGRKIFSYTPKFVIMEGTFATIKAHWHCVATDLNPKSEDFKQILHTPWLDVISTKLNGVM